MAGPYDNYDPNRDPFVRNQPHIGPGRGTPLSQETPGGLLDQAALSTSMIPGIGDVVGLLSDANHLRKEPTAGNFGMSLLGALPFVPAMSVTRMFKGAPPTTKVVDDSMPLFDDVLREKRIHLKGWKEQLKNTDPDTASHFDTSIRVERMEREIAALEDAGELPFTFYAAKDKGGAQYFADQFEGGAVRRVDVESSNLATVEDVMALKDADGHPLNPYRRGTVSHLNAEEIVALKKAGFDGAVGPIDNLASAGDEVVVFSPDQVKFKD